MSKFALLLVIAIVITLWILANPRGRFGYSTFGMTTYNAIPIPYFDVIVHRNGALSLREEKTHFILLNESRGLLNESPQFLIVGTGYKDLVTVDPRVNSTPVNVEVMKTPRALKRFNQLKQEGKNITAIIHSTC